MRNTLLFILILWNAAYAQHKPGGTYGRPQGPAIAGMVQDEAGDPVPYASVALYSSADSVLVAGAATNEQGRFIMKVKPGAYYVRITFLSFEEKLLPNVKVSSGLLRLGRIVMKKGSMHLREVEIEAEKPQMELKLDKRVFNVSKDMSNVGATAAEVLDNIPSVEVDVEGKVSLRGSENVRILIDGKPSGLTGISSTDALRQLQGDMVEKIEVITNPSARYDAEGEAGIINIILKKEQQKGVNGSFTLQAGEPANHSVSLNMNSRRKHFNIFTSGSVRYRQSPGGGNSNTIFRYADTTYRYTEQRDHIRGGWSGNLQLGTDLYLSDKNTLTLAGRYNLSDNDNNATLLYRDYNEDDVLTQTVNRTEEETSTRENQSLRMNYRKEFMQEDRLFTLDASWEQSADDEYADLYETSDDTSVDPLTQRTSNLQAESRWHFQTDYVHPFGPEGKFETGAKASLRDLDNDYGLEQQQSDASWQVIPDFDNHLRYIENIYAAYVMAGNKTGKFSYQGGLRTEYSDITTELIQTQELNHRTYLDLFPSAHFSYELKKNNFLQLSYSRRIRRPRFWYLLPFFGFSDSRSIWSGNPNLDPEFTHSLETGYLRQWDNGSLLSSVYYRHTDGVIERISFSDSVGFTQRFPVNLATRDAYGLELSGSWQPFQWWSINGSANFYRSITDGQYEQQDFFSDTYALTGRLSSKWTVKRKFSCQTSVKYRSARETAQGKRYPSYNWDAGFAVDMLKGNGTLSFSARDILNTHKHHAVTYESTFTSESEFQWHTRQFALSFNYRINQKKKRSRWNGGEMEGEGFEMEM